MSDSRDAGDVGRKETPEDEQAALQLLMRRLDAIESLRDQFDQWEVRPRSALAGDDKALPRDRMSDHVRGALAVAFDNFTALRLIAQTGRFPAFAHYALLRNAVEAVGIGTWVLGPSSRDERVIRALGLSLEDLGDIHGLEQSLKGVTGKAARLPGDDTVRVRLEEIRDEREALRGAALTMPSITARLIAAQEYVGEYPISILSVWKLASGYAHGRRSVILGTLDRELLEADDTGVGLLVTANLGQLAGVSHVAKHYLDRLLNLVEARNTDPRSVYASVAQDGRR